MPDDGIPGEEPLLVHARPWKVLLSGVCMAALILAAIAFGVLLPGLAPKLYMVVIVLSLGWALSIFVRRVVPDLRNGQVGYTVDNSGIHGQALAVPFVAWEDVVCAKRAAKRSTGLIELSLMNYEKYVPAKLQTARHRMVKRLAPAAIGALDLATGSVTNPFDVAATEHSARGDVSDVREATRDIADGLLRVPTRGFDHSADEVLDAINCHLAVRGSTRPAT